MVLCGEQQGPGEAMEVAERIGGAVESLGEEDGVPVPLSASVGVAMSEPDDDEDTLLRRADHAMYRASTASGRWPRRGDEKRHQVPRMMTAVQISP